MISELEEKGRGPDSIRAAKKKKEWKKWRQFKGLMGQHQANHHPLEKSPRRREKGAEKLFREITVENFPNLVENNRHPEPGSAESSKEDEPIETHTKAHYNWNVKS